MFWLWSIKERLWPWFPSFFQRSGSDHSNWTSTLTCPSTSAQLQDARPANNFIRIRHFIQLRRLPNCVPSPEVLLCIDMEKILHRRKCHISYQCLRHICHTFQRNVTEISIVRFLKCLWFYTLTRNIFKRRLETINQNPEVDINVSYTGVSKVFVFSLFHIRPCICFLISTPAFVS